ncbi:hypothetical protein HZC31_04140 [Candidatus Woesearchaeota archaeon]|nr:hypothetical protein [Candidatus Woesearchaeota archaeon]
MVTLTADVTSGVKHLTQELVKKGMYKSQSEVVRDAIRQLAFKYGVRTTTKREVRKIVTKASKVAKQSLSEAVRGIRDEA